MEIISEIYKSQIICSAHTYLTKYIVVKLIKISKTKTQYQYCTN